MDAQIGIIASWLTSNDGVLSICTAILLWVVFAFFSFRRRIGPIVKGVNLAIADISGLDGEQGFAQNFEAFDEKLKQNPVFGHAWGEFEETLIKDPLMEPLAVRNTRSAGEFFNRNSAIGDRLNLRFYSALPNLLTGTGILGTFIGLVAGIWLASGGLGSNDTDTVKQALENLLNGASLAFMTSIVGLVSSIFFSWGEKHATHRLDGRIRTWNDHLDARLRRVTGETFAMTQLAESKQQTEILTQFTNDLAFQIADAFQDRMSHAIGPTMERLVSAVEEMRSDQGKRNDEALHAMLEKFSASLSGSAGQELETLGQTLSNLNDKLETQIGALGDRQEQINAASTKSIDDLSNVFKWSISQVKKGVSEAIDEVVIKVGSLVNEIGQATETAARVSGEYKEILDSTSEAVSDLNDAASTMTSLATPMAEAAVSFKRTAEDIKAASDHHQQVAAEVGQALGRIAEIQSELKDSWARYEARFDQVDASLAKVVQELVNGIDNYTDRIKEMVNGLDQHTSSIVADLAGANSELSSAVEELADTLNRHRA